MLFSFNLILVLICVYHVFCIFLSFFVLKEFNNILFSDHVSVRIFLFDSNIEHLIFKSFWSHLEVQQSDFHADFRWIMWSRVFSCNVETETIIIFNLFFIEFHCVAAAFFRELLEQHRFVKRINIFTHVLEENRSS